MPSLSRFLERCDEIGQGAVVDSASALCCRDCETDRQVALAHTRWSKQDHILSSLDEAQRVQTLDLLAFDAGLEAEVEVGQHLDGWKPGRAHRSDEAAIIPERDLRSQELLDCIARCDFAAVDSGEYVIVNDRLKFPTFDRVKLPTAGACSVLLSMLLSV